MTKEKPGADSRLPGEMLTAHLLALLKNWSGYGYELAKKLEEAGFGTYNSGTLYRTLRQMERTGLISSLWDTSADGPARRMYSVTNAGSIFLSNWLRLIELHRSTLAQFMYSTLNDDPPEMSDDRAVDDTAADATAAKRGAARGHGNNRVTKPDDHK